MKYGILFALGGASIWTSQHLGARDGLLGASLGVAFAALLGIGSSAAARLLRTLEPHLLPGAMLLIVGASFVLMASFVLAVGFIQRELVAFAALSAIAVYLPFRFIEAFEASKVKERTS